MSLPAYKIDNEEQAHAALAEMKRYLSVEPPSFIDEKFKKQAAFLRDPSKRRAVQCTRRAGKSYGIGLGLYKDAYEDPGCSVVYLGLTRPSAKRIMWKDIIKNIDKRFGLGMKPNESELVARLPNSSEIHILGADSSPKEMEKALGTKLKRVVIDEAGSFRQDLRKLVYEILEPALSDYDGAIDLVGTPTELINSFFFDVTTGKEQAGWSIHKWNTYDNPYMEAKWKTRMDRLIAENPRIVETPGFRRMYLNEWVIDTSSLVYKYDESRNSIDSLPDGDYVYTLGIDLGYEDPSAFVVAAYREYDRKLYFVDCYKRSGMNLTEVAQRIAYYQKKYDLHYMVIDNASKQGVEEIKDRYNLNLIPAEKKGKNEYIELMNAEYIQGNIQVLTPNCDELPTEYGALIWDKEATKRAEHPNCANHAADAALYAFRHCFNYLAEPAPEIRAIDDEIEEALDQEFMRDIDEEDKPFWEQDWRDVI